MPSATPITAVAAVVRRRMQWLRDPRFVGALLLLAAFVAIALFVPHPDAEQIRDWARAADALTGGTDPALIVVSAICVAIGSAGLLADARLGVEEPDVEDPVGSSTQV